MKAQPDMVVTTGVKGSTMIDERDTYGDAKFIQALDLIDRATLALHVSRNAPSLQAQITHACEASNAFTRSLELLHQSKSPQHESEDWNFWFDEATGGRKLAETLRQPERDLT